MGYQQVNAESVRRPPPPLQNFLPRPWGDQLVKMAFNIVCKHVQLSDVIVEFDALHHKRRAFGSPTTLFDKLTFSTYITLSKRW